MHAIFDNDNSTVDRITDSAVSVTSYDLILTCIVNSPLNNSMATTSMLFLILIFRHTQICVISTGKIIQSLVQLTYLPFVLATLLTRGNHFHKLIN